MPACAAGPLCGHVWVGGGREVLQLAGHQGPESNPTEMFAKTSPTVLERWALSAVGAQEIQPTHLEGLWWSPSDSFELGPPPPPPPHHRPATASRWCCLLCYL